MRLRKAKMGQLWRPHFVKGEKVEVKRSDGVYYAATVRRLPSFQKSVVFVEYQTLSVGPKRLKEHVDLGHLRPAPPREINCFFKAGDIVDAFLENGWRRGVVKDLLENSSYIVTFDGDGEEARRETEVHQWSLRLHREWEDGSWLPPFQEPMEDKSKQVRSKEDKPMQVRLKFTLKEGTPEAKFKVGDKVEVTSDLEGFVGSWFSGHVVDHVGDDKFVVEYENLVTEDEKPLREEIEARHIRPAPPNLSRFVRFEPSQVVDAWYNDGWWVGVITKMVKGSNYMVYFSPTNEEIEFRRSHLRVHQEWSDGKWSVSSGASNC